MPAISKKQRKMMAMAEHHPEELYKKNKNVLSMSKKQMHDFASTKETGLPKLVKKLMKGYRSLEKCPQGGK